MSTGIKYDGEKPRLDLIPVEYNIGTGLALTFGAKKYGQHNFRNGIAFSRLLAAAKRHVDLELAKVEFDKDSGLEHWTQASASLAMYAFMKAHRHDFDDRYEYTEEQRKKIVEMMYGKE